ncbi:MAG TPA: ATP-binding cassette domain-containing protein [Gemmatimonadaceae bacterium]|nr:ATP-binding cassette domain-containing protein [Gemmatimonadaceae bacterium]
MPSSTSSRASSEPALAATGLTGPRGAPTVHDVNLVVPRAATRLVLGAIHAGKSMVLRHLVGLECAAAGRITIAGELFDPTSNSPTAVRRMQTRIGVLFESSALISRISVVDNVELPMLEHTGATRGEARDAARELLAEVGVPSDDDVTPVQLGRSDRRRVALARAVALRPPIVLMDEPTHGLDAGSAAALDDTVARLQERHGFGVLIFSREVRHAFGPASHIYVMRDGRIVASGDRDTLGRSDDPAVHQLFHRRGD